MSTDRSCVRVAGRFDAAEVVPFQGQIHTALPPRRQPQDLVLDLAAVDFFDSRALIAVLQTCQQVQATGGKFRLRCPSGAVLAILDLTNTSSDFLTAA